MVPQQRCRHPCMLHFVPVRACDCNSCGKNASMLLNCEFKALVNVATFPKVCEPYRYTVKRGSVKCQCVRSSQVFAIHNNLGLLPPSTVRDPETNALHSLTRKGSIQSPKYSAAVSAGADFKAGSDVSREVQFIQFHRRYSCERLRKALRDACFEVNHPAQCLQEWPMSLVRFAIFGRTWYNRRKAIADSAREHLGVDGQHKFCFVGRSPYHLRMQRRAWIENFARRYFDNTSLFVYTDIDKTTGLVGGIGRKRKHIPLGPFDHTLNYNGEGFVPTQHGLFSANKLFPGQTASNLSLHHVDTSYFQRMARCKYMLVPGGDAPWSIRFYGEF